MALKTFNIRLLLGTSLSCRADSRELWKRAIKACIPVKSKWDGRNQEIHLEIARNLVKWYDEHPKVRRNIPPPPKSRAVSIIKRVAQGSAVARASTKDVAGKLHFDQQMTKTVRAYAWMNESLCQSST